MNTDTFDLLVIGAGTQGTGIAADAAGRGLRVCLLDEQDIGESTANVSSRLLVGGLRYLEQWHLGLVRQSLAERQTLLHRAGFLVQIRPFIQVVHPERMRLWQSRLLMHAYDWLGARTLGRHSIIDLNSHPHGTPLRREFATGLLYRDCTGYDARLAVLNARLAHASGAVIRPGARLLRLRRAHRSWEIEMEAAGSSTQRLTAAALVNTAGPWVEELLRQTGITSHCRARQVKISHLVVPALYEGDQVYVLTSGNGHRICVNPIGDGLHLVGAAENDFGGQSDPTAPSAGEISWLCQTVSEYFARPLHEKDVVHSFSGLRTVYDDPGRPGTQVARHFLLDLDCPDCHSPLLRVYGGRVTNYRRMGESALQILKPWLPEHSGRWTQHTPLPGGAMTAGGVAGLRKELQSRFPGIPAPQLDRLISSYGSETASILGNATPAGAAPAVLPMGLFAGEVQHLRDHEWAHNARQALRRVGLEYRATPEGLAELDRQFH